jgi:glucokinase
VTGTPDRGVVAVDVGGTTIKAGVLTDGGATAMRRVPTRVDEGPDAVVDRIIAITAELVDQAAVDHVDIAAAGVVIPGIVDETAGIGRLAVNLGWHDVPLRERLVDRLGGAVIVGHDVRAAALAESRWGSAAGHSSALFVPIGTGIAATLVVAGEIWPGAAFQAGEIGQVPVGEGTLETVASGHSIAARYMAAAPPGTAVTAADVIQRAEEGDQLAAAVWQQALASLADVLASAVAMLDPAVIVVGGGVSRAGPALLDPLRAGLTSRLPWRRPPALTTARFGDDAGWVGAALLALAAARLAAPEPLGAVVAASLTTNRGDGPA